MLTTGLPVSRYVSVSVSLTTPAVIEAAINTAVIVGTSHVIDVDERMRSYANIGQIAHDFGNESEEYHAAAAWFSQMPSPDNLMIGRWIREATPAMLRCGVLTPAERRPAVWELINGAAGPGFKPLGEFEITIGAGPPIPITGLNFGTIVNLNGVAAIINAAVVTALGGTVPAPPAVPGDVVVHWDGERFVFATLGAGVTESIGYLTSIAGGTGTDLAPLLRGTSATGARRVGGADPETALSAVEAIDGLYSSLFYGVIVPSADPAINAVGGQLDIALYCEAADPPKYFGATSDDVRVLDSIMADIEPEDLPTQLYLYGYNKTAVQYSTSNPYAICSYLSRILTTRWRAMNSTITLMYKRQPGVQPENITYQEADTLQEKHCNVYVGIANGAQIIQYGTSASGEFTDTIIGADALALDVQNSLFNVLYTTNTKVPQTDMGMTILINACDAVCATYVRNGYLGPGVWNAPGVGAITQGQLLNLGYYVYAPSMGDQSLADRAARIAPLIQILAKCAGAIHHADVLIFVNQ